MDTSPIVHELSLTCSPERAFEVFTAHIGEWWDPAYTGSPDTYSTVTIDPRLRGQVTERHTDGSEHDWGEVIAWDPPAKVAFSFTLAQDRTLPSLVRVTFVPSDAGTHVTFEHDGWTELNVESRGKFDEWPRLLARFQEATR